MRNLLVSFFGNNWVCGRQCSSKTVLCKESYSGTSLPFPIIPPFNLGSPFFFRSVHYVTPVVAALGLDTSSSPLPNTTISFPNPYNSANIISMGGHLVLERLTCNATVLSSAGTFIRILLAVRLGFVAAVVPL